jgi:hypothetical protein
MRWNNIKRKPGKIKGKNGINKGKQKKCFSRRHPEPGSGRRIPRTARIFAKPSRHLSGKSPLYSHSFPANRDSP